MRLSEVRCEKTQSRLSRDCQEIRRNAAGIKGREREGDRQRESISKIKNNYYGGRGNRTNSAVPGEGGGPDDDCLLVSGAFAFPRVQCVSPPPRNPRAPRISARSAAIQR